MRPPWPSSVVSTTYFRNRIILGEFVKTGLARIFVSCERIAALSLPDMERLIIKEMRRLYNLAEPRSYCRCARGPCTIRVGPSKFRAKGVPRGKWQLEIYRSSADDSSWPRSRTRRGLSSHHSQ